MAGGICVDWGRPKGYTAMNIFYSFSSLFLCLWNLSPYETELIFHSSWTLPLDPSSVQAKKCSTTTPTPLPHPTIACRTLSGARHWSLVASAAMAGHAEVLVLSTRDATGSLPAQAFMALAWELTCRQLYREPEHKWSKMPVCPSPYVYWGDMCVCLLYTSPSPRD